MMMTTGAVWRAAHRRESIGAREEVVSGDYARELLDWQADAQGREIKMNHNVMQQRSLIQEIILITAGAD